MTTIKDVAQKVGVTAATVSNVIRSKGPVAEKTRKRVLQAIEELGYRPNLMARGLQQGKSLTLALLLPNIANPFYPEIALEVENVARGQGYQLLLCNTHDEESVGRHYLERFGGGWVDGVLAMSGGINLEDLEHLAARGVGVVRCLFDEELERRKIESNLPSVDANWEQAAKLVTQHLVDLGHRHFAAIIHGNSDGQISHIARLRGLQSVLKHIKANLEPNMIFIGDSSLESGYRLTQQLLQNPKRPTAILCSNDLMALGAIEAALDAGLEVPHDLSVVGIDDIAIGAHVRPALTTAAIPKREFAIAATELLLRQVQHDSPKIEHITVEPQLVVRRSSGQIKPNKKVS
jgi:DNA-binding LacI/PurR family transcriptional regulator